MSSKRKICLQFIIYSLLIIYGEARPKQVCIIGAGRAGLAAIKLVADQIGKFVPIAFERNSDVGGLWIYTDKTDVDERGLPVHSSVYKNLKTITPKEEMTYPDYEIFKSPNYDRYVPHQTFLQYMRNYTNHFGLRKYIQFNTMVTNVTPVKDKCRRDAVAWQIENRNLNTNKVEQTICDGVIVCNGRHSKPNKPYLPGIALFSGRILHSHAYRRPEEFTAQTVVVWGSGASATGIARDLSNHAKKVYVSHRRKLSWDRAPAANVKTVKSIAKFNGRDFVLEDNTKITADAFIYCTGYLYDFPFLDDNSGMTRDKYRLYPLARNLMNKRYPTMAFVGLGHIDYFGDDFYYEAKYFLSTLKGRDN